MVEKMAGCILTKTRARPLGSWAWPRTHSSQPRELSAPARSSFIAVVAASVVALSSLCPSTASADPRTEFFVKQLKTSDDFKVRTQAALALGASGDSAAVDPLCSALAGDANSSVKVAAAAALGKLGKAEGASCLKTAKGREKDSSVLAQIDQSLDKLGGGAESSITANTKFYVAIQVTNNTGRGDAEIDRVVRSSASAKLLAASGYAIAPKSESPTQGGEVCKTKKLKGLLLITAVDKAVYSGGKVSISFNSTIWTYPDKSLKATINGKRSTDAQGSSDIEGENLLIQAASEDAATKLIAAAAKL